MGPNLADGRGPRQPAAVAGGDPLRILDGVGALAVDLRGVVKSYGELCAVDGLDLAVPEGTCVGLLGPNGAGKSTTMKLLTAQAIADAGTLRVLGPSCLGRASRRVRGWASSRSSTTSTRRSASATTCGSSRGCTACPAASGRPPSTAALQIATLTDRADDPGRPR